MRLLRSVSAAVCGVPEHLESAAEPRTAQSQDGVSAVEAPVHPSALEAVADDDLAPGFNDAGRGAEPFGAEAMVAHTVLVALEVRRRLASLLTAGLVRTEDSEKGVEVSGLELVIALPSPGGGEVAGGSIDRPRHLAEVLHGVEEVDDLGRPRKELVGEIPDPQCPIAEEDLASGTIEASTLRFALDSLPEGSHG